MIAFSYKAKQYGWIALKGMILIVTAYYLYHKLSQSEREIDWLQERFSESSFYAFFLLFFGMASVNWLLEARKWHAVVATTHPISYGMAWRQSLMALTSSLTTPNRIGEYGAKALFFPAKQRKKIVLLNLASQGSQMAVTLLMGSIGIWWLRYRLLPLFHLRTLFWFVLAGIVLMGLLYFFRKKNWFLKGASPLRVWRFYRSISTGLWVKLMGISLLRYGCFSFLFYLILSVFGAPINFMEAYPVILVMYLMVSIIPSFVLLDVVIRAGIAVWLFSFHNIQEITILGTVFLMWILNVVLPALLGTWYLVTLKKQPI
tara:strand:- start:14460 stop:15407 length:948 start_codon:yes stop_codon:yes gene_type:complete